ncbi:Major facilitator superfamily [Trinorchestia longiramus]|nr:Major facilitator superfamily [Trinorchestia longiramus]
MRSTHTPAPTVRTPLLPSSVVEDEDYTRIYKSRFWVLGVFSTFGCFLAWQFNTWGPINESVVVAYPEWSSTTVALMPNLTSAVFVVFVWPVCILVQRLGLRVAMLSACSLTSFALALRCASQDPTVFTWLCMVSSSLQGVAMTIMLAVPPLLAVDWFPPSERATAQGLVFAMDQLGILVSYLEPMLVRAPGSGVTVQEIKDDISQLMYICELVL